MHRAERAPSRRLINAAWVLIAVVAIVGTVTVLLDRDAGTDDDGLLTETTYTLPATVTPPVLVDTTAPWGLEDRAPSRPAAHPMAGGLAFDDLDGDGFLDLVVAHGSVDIYLWRTDHYEAVPDIDVDRAMGVTTSDLDADGRPDLLIAREGDVDSVVWGGAWVTDRVSLPDRLDLPGASPSTGLLAAELSGDDRLDIVRLGRGTAQPAHDVLWTADPGGERSFTPQNLGTDARYSLAGEIADIDHDGLLDIWVTRDVGWDAGGDSIYSRQGDPLGEWVDISSELGADLEVDGMGVTLADFNGDQRLDAYVSDIGDNEILVRDGDRFIGATDTGAARIRSPGAASSIVSSSWATGAADLNLDGVLDLVVANGGFPDGGVRNRFPDTDVAIDDPPSILIGIGGGRYADVWPDLDFVWESASRGMTIGDIDNDGDDDLVFIGVDGSLQAFRNDAVDPSVAVVAAPGCDTTGATVTVSQPEASYQSLFRSHTYGGAHASSVIVGVRGDEGVVTVDWPSSRDPFVAPIDLTGGRRQIVDVTC